MLSVINSPEQTCCVDHPNNIWAQGDSLEYPKSYDFCHDQVNSRTFWLKTQQCHCGLLDKWYILCVFVPRIPAQTWEIYKLSANLLSNLFNDRLLLHRCAHVGGVQWGPPSLRQPHQFGGGGNPKRRPPAPEATLGPRHHLPAHGVVLEGGKLMMFTCATASFCWIYSLLLYCWQKPEDRPCFTLLLHELASISWLTTTAAFYDYKLSHIYFIYWVVAT